MQGKFKIKIPHLLILFKTLNQQFQQFKFEMLRQKRLSRQKQLLEDTCQSMPRSLPKKVEQQTVKHNYQQLTTIPLVLHADCIKHLYLSHNKIASLRGIEAFLGLETFNVSYNCLEKVQQLRRIANPPKLRHLKIRMNPLQFGYEDYAVGLFENLKTFQDIKLRNQAKQNLLIMRDYLGKNIISFVKITKKFRQVLQIEQFDKENNDYTNLGKRNTCKGLTFIQLNNEFLDKLKGLYTFPAQEVIRSCSISELLSKVYTVMQLFCQATVHKGENNKEQYLVETRQSYNEIVDLILLKFSAKYDKTLVNYLNKIQRQLNFKHYSQCFSKLGVFAQVDNLKFEVNMNGGGLKLPHMDSQPAKYIQKIDTKALNQHPMNKLANWQLPQHLNTLIPIEQAKWYNYYNRRDLKEQEDQLYQQIPMFVYNKAYLQVISEILFERVSQILNKENELLKFRDFQTKISNQTIINKANEDEIEFQLSRSDALSFGDKSNHILEFRNLQEYDSKQQSQNKDSKFMQIPKKTVPKPYFKNQRQLKQAQNNYAYNIAKYTLHDINLAYKVFRSLKKRVNNRKEKLSFEQ